MPEHLRKDFHQRIMDALKPGGLLILQAFTKEQLGNKSGGPKFIDMLFSEQVLKEDFANLYVLECNETKEILNEGPYHQGEANLISLYGKKRLHEE